MTRLSRVYRIFRLAAHFMSRIRNASCRSYGSCPLMRAETDTISIDDKAEQMTIGNRDGRSIHFDWDRECLIGRSHLGSIGFGVV